ncbi:DUF5134 domain-containing protein [Mycobacterium sp. SM1]|uniref:DUF5134 domain-containing protein n=1 Tax=Mycobacterium sp. SM1 TaxID=2816243 RepID=UPI001BCDE9CE|nr:DUF5134 domain-containing protein [Mycobacterium sp. SM1]MBS4728006.1 DUF5134 domain-containing protein [Mycobacterium sp. SM1]
MSAPFWYNAVVAALMLATSLFAAGRLATAALRRHAVHCDVDVADLLMGIAMADMFLPQLAILPNTTWALVFAAAMVWFFARSVREYARYGPSVHVAGHYPPHSVQAGAMVYMGLAARSMPAMSGPMGSAMGSGGAARLPLLAFLLVVFMAGYIVFLVDRLGSPPPPRPTPPLPAPRTADLQMIAMSIGMGCALVTMI